MGRFIEGCDRREVQLLPDCVDDYVAADSQVRVIDLFVDEVELAALGFADAAVTGRPGYHPATMLKLIYTAISTRCSRAAGLSARRGAIWS